MKILLKNGRILEKELVEIDMLIVDSVIQEISENIEIKPDYDVYDLRGNFISPGFIDMHVHLREPGFEHKETIETGTMAAARGGYTTICPMPNISPVPDTVEKVDKYLKLIEEKARVRVLPYASITLQASEQGEVVDMERLRGKVCGFSNDGVGIQSAKLMYEAMQTANKYESLIAAHCEDESLLFGGYVHRGLKSEREGWKGITSLSESIQIARDVLIAEETNSRYHVCHISTKEGVRIVKEAKERGLKVTCEVTPHHLLLVDNDVQNTNYKMNPPLRGVDDKYSLIKALVDGTIDVIATDHAPHADFEKELGMDRAPFGIVGLETAFPLIYTYLIKTNMATLSDAIKWFSLNPAKILNLESGKLREGRIADLTIIDLHSKKKIKRSKFHSKGKNTPFDGWECYGWPVMTIVGGNVVYKDEKIEDFI
ncbi:dihydroorotase [Mycoplasmatota bacterium]|nr:dihydroorotase [Mycoplasmatota bacterium]